MTHTKANKSKILTLILGLATCLVLMLGIVFASPVDTARAEETDTRIVVSTITATSNIDDIIGFGKSVKSPSFNIEEAVPAQFQTQYNWEKKTATSWEDYSGTAFTEGTYRYVTQIRIEGTGATTHVLDKNGITVTVNGKKWDNSIPDIYDTYSFAWVESEEYPVTAPAGTPLDFVKDNKWDIDSTYINQAITAFSVADGAVGGTKPYTFSKVSGPEWIDVAADGTVSGTPTALGANAALVIKVTDSGATPETKEITLDVGNTYVLPADREVISVIRATSNIGENIGYGKPVFTPSFTFTEGAQANFYGPAGQWYKKDGTDWKRYTEATFTEGTYMYGNQLRVDDEYGMSHVLNKDGVSVYIDDKLCVDKQKPDAIYDTYSYIYVGTAEIKVEKPTTVAITDELVPVTDLEKVYNETAQEPTFGGTLVRDTDFEVSYAVKAGSTGRLDFSGKPVDAGTYIVTVTGKGAYKGSFTKDFVIAKADGQGAPILIGYAPTKDGGSDGKITGTTNKMEYDVDSLFTNPQDCTDGETTGLTEGVYYVRIKETDNYKASATSQVEVRLYKVTVEDGAGRVVTKHRTGDTVTITVNKPTGKALNKWVYGGVTIPDVTKETITFEMPNCDVSLVAVFEDVEYSITVTNGTATPETATYQAEVTVTANAPATGKEFDKWVVSGITLSDEDLAKSTVTFKMPASNVKMEAHFRDIESAPSVEIKVNGGTGAGTYKEGESVTVTANEPAEGKEFVGWKDESGKIVSTQKEYTFVVKDEMVLTAVYQDKAPGGGTIDGEIAPAPDKNGLSGGQIAGIVIGSIAGVGIVGFAIFWFVVKKKSFADLITAIKALFNKKQ